MKTERLNERDLNMVRVFITYEEGRLSQLDESIDDIHLINKIKSNIKLYKDIIKKAER